MLPVAVAGDGAAGAIRMGWATEGAGGWWVWLASGGEMTVLEEGPAGGALFARTGGMSSSETGFPLLLFVLLSDHC